MKKDKYQVLEDIIREKEKETFESLKDENTLSKETIQNLLSLNEVQIHLNYEATIDYIMIYPSLEKIFPYILESFDTLSKSRIIIEKIHYTILKQELFYFFMKEYHVTDPYEKLYYLTHVLPEEDYQDNEIISNLLDNYSETIFLLNHSHNQNHTMSKYRENSLRILLSIDFQTQLNQTEKLQILKLVQNYHYDYMDKNIFSKIEDQEFDPNKCIKKITEIIKYSQKPNPKKYRRN